MAAILPVSIRTAQYLQEHDLASRGLLDTLGSAPTTIWMARTEQERREKVLDRIIVIGSAFVLAPLHGLAFMLALAKRHRFDPAFMRLSYKDLHTSEQLKQGVQQLKKELPKLTSQLKLPQGKTWEGFRKELIEAKTHMLIPDLTIECLIFGGVGWITNFFTRLYTGKNRFSGELKATSQENLNALYEKEKGYQKNERLRMAATLVTSLALPLGIGLLLKRALLFKKPKISWLPANLFEKARKLAPLFDYKDGFWMSLTGLGVVCMIQFMGHLMSARNKREFKENFFREAILNTFCFGSTPAWMWALTKLLKIKSKSVETLVKQGQRKAAQKLSWIYLSSFLMGSASLAAGIVGNNALTQYRVNQDVQKLKRQHDGDYSTRGKNPTPLSGLR